MDCPYNSKYKLAKICMDLEENETARIIFEELLNEDDSDPEMWYYMSLNYHLLSENALAKEYIEKCISVLFVS